MRLIKKYANRKLYDTQAKQYIAQRRVAELIKKGEPVRVIDHVTGEDITAAVVSRLLGEENTSENGDVSTGIPTGILVQLLRKGSDTITDYAHKYTALFQSALTMAEDEVDGLVHRLLKNREITVAEARRLKRDLPQYTGHLKTWIGEKIDQRVNEILEKMNLATRAQVATLTHRIETLSRKVGRLEKAVTEKPSGQRPGSGRDVE
jgi:polyhydroxyalkanoate synthesis repressor PhaR